MGQIYLVASGKGGVGKTTVTANIAACLAKSGNRVLCFDADLSLGNLDILMDKRDEAVFDIQDVFLKRCDFEKTLLEHEEISGLFFLPAPSMPQVEIGELRSFIIKLAEQRAREYDFIFIDCPAGLGGVSDMITAETVLLLVATPDEASVRGAEKVAEIAYSSGARARLIVNKVRPDLIKRELAPNIDDIIDDTAVRLIGVIPEDNEIIKVSARNSLLCLSKNKRSLIAFENIAARLCGADVPLAKIK